MIPRNGIRPTRPALTVLFFGLIALVFAACGSGDKSLPTTVGAAAAQPTMARTSTAPPEPAPTATSVPAPTPTPVLPMVTPVPPTPIPEPTVEGPLSVKMSGAPVDLAFDGTNVWVVGRDSGKLTKVSPDGEILGSFKAARIPNRVVFGAGSIWVADTDGNKVVKVSLDGEVTGQFEARFPKDVEFDGANIWVAGGRILRKLAPDGSEILSVETDFSVDFLLYDGESIWAMGERGKVARFALDGGQKTSFEVGPVPTSIVFDGEALWVAASDGVAKYAPDGTEEGRYGAPPAGVRPLELFFDGQSVWAGYAESKDEYSVGRGVALNIALDGTVKGTYLEGNGGLGFTSDGVNMWILSHGVLFKLTPEDL